jgi:hypothetical protein
LHVRLGMVPENVVGLQDLDFALTLCFLGIPGDYAHTPCPENHGNPTKIHGL